MTIKIAINGFIKKAFEIPVDVADDYLKAAVEALMEYLKSGDGKEGGGEA
jgi:hypothetical protein